MYNEDGISKWNQLSNNCESFWKKHAPVSWAELEGMSNIHCHYKVDQKQRHIDFLHLGSDFEMQMSAWRNPSLYRNIEEDINGQVSDRDNIERGKCTGFAMVKSQSQSMCGQNVDEDGADWLEGSKDVLLKLMSDDPNIVPHAMVYTHPGVPAYCGMNSSGLCVLNLYIDSPKEDNEEEEDKETQNIYKNKSRNDRINTNNKSSGYLPIDVTIRELLTHHNITQALDWLQQTPRMVPTTYLILHGSTIACVEICKNRMVTCISQGSSSSTMHMCHSNHPLLDEVMFQTVDKEEDKEEEDGKENEEEEDKDTQAIGGNKESYSEVYSSVNRLRHIREKVKKMRNLREDINIESIQNLLIECPSAHPVYAPTLASVILDPKAMVMHVKFRNDKEWISEDFAP